MDLWMYLVVIGMFIFAIIGTVWITLWTIQRGERARAERTGGTPPVDEGQATEPSEMEKPTE